MKHLTEFTHTLLSQFEYAREGQRVQAETLTVYAPSNKILPFTSVLEQEYSRSMISLAHKMRGMENQNEAEVKEDGSDESANQVVLLLGADGDLQKCYEALRHILISGNTDKPACRVDNVQKLTMPIYDGMSPKDTKIILGKYIINFLGFSPGS